MNKSNAYFITGTAYAGKSTMVRLLAEKYISQGEKIKIIKEDEFLGMLWKELID